jgi:hypothetical protein
LDICRAGIRNCWLSWPKGKFWLVCSRFVLLARNCATAVVYKSN